jgi:hypothetical protein
VVSKIDSNRLPFATLKKAAFLGQPKKKNKNYLMDF